MRHLCDLPIGLRSGLLAACCLLGAGSSQAGRPLTTDDASTAGAGNCQLETWLERSPDQRTFVFAPACGLSDSVELDFSANRSKSALPSETGLGVALKWVDPAWTLGSLSLGGKLWIGQRRRPDAAPHMDEDGAALLASQALGESLTVHANAGMVRHPDDGKGHGMLNLALAWAPHPLWLAFAELNAVTKLPSQRAAGLRLWLRPDVLGLDLTSARTADRPDQPATSVVSVGLGWYNIKY
jgi:hypothetical protein